MAKQKHLEFHYNQMAWLIGSMWQACTNIHTYFRKRLHGKAASKQNAKKSLEKKTFGYKLQNNSGNITNEKKSTRNAQQKGNDNAKVNTTEMCTFKGTLNLATCSKVSLH